MICKMRCLIFAGMGLAIVLMTLFLSACDDNGTGDTATPQNTTESPRITVEEVKALMDSGERVFFIDSRSQTQWDEAATRLPGAVHIPDNKVSEHLNEIPNDQRIVVYCT